MRLTRRVFTRNVACSALFGSRFLSAQSTARPNVAAIEHDRILRLGDEALGQTTPAITSLAGPHTPGTSHDYFSNDAFTGHREALRLLCVRVAALAAAFGISKDDKYASAAVEPLRAWFITPATRMTPNLNFARVVPDATQAPTGTPEGLIEAVFLAELAQALVFLNASQVLTDADLAGLKSWFAAYLTWLTEPGDSGPRIAALARDLRNHHGSSWLLQTVAIARFTGNDAVLSDCRHRFKTVTLRAQVVMLGNFPAELTTPNPYRNSLLNLDLLTGACELMATPFETLWDYELQDGPGMRAAIAYFFPFIQKRSAWPFPADKLHFNDLPLRRPALLFTARAYTRPEYADLWRTLAADPPEAADHEIAEAFPIRQPYLWVTRPPRRVLS
ncbi:alginate lyase family protein [Granulicella sibirica]|uniref:alginate lyase family protein n=1 Tax=Granulicella sibirica TaxID=2479048 RepID=UPI00100896EF|nr:alginate lyase family protein [Granulicella sibirica]